MSNSLWLVLCRGHVLARRGSKTKEEEVMETCVRESEGRTLCAAWLLAQRAAGPGQIRAREQA